MEGGNGNVISNYVLGNDWRFASIVQFVNVFKNVLSVESISTTELENSLKNPEIDSTSLNILLKLLLKKALFKPNLKVHENFEFEKLQDMLLKKLNYFYKIYLRHIKKLYPDITNMNELVKEDIKDYYTYKDTKFNLDYDNLNRKIDYEMNIENLLIVDFFREMDGRNPLSKTSIIQNNLNDLNESDNEKNNKIVDSTNKPNNNQNQEDYYNFNELQLEDKIKILYFLCSYALSFSGRSPFYRDEIVKENPENTNQDIIKAYKRISPIGRDKDNNSYTILLSNKDCRLYLENENEFKLACKNYEELEKFILNLEYSKNQNEINLIKQLKENLLKLKEFDEEEKKKDSNFNLKIQLFQEKSKKSSEQEKINKSEYYVLLNTSGHVTTRNQLSQITKVSNLISNGINNPTNKQILMTEEEKKRIKIEKEKQERQRRLEKRNRILERKFQNSLKKDQQAAIKASQLIKPRDESKNVKVEKNLQKKRNRALRRKNDSWEDEEIFESEEESESSAQIELLSDKDDKEDDGGESPESPTNNGNNIGNLSLNNQDEIFGNQESIQLLKNIENYDEKADDIILQGNLIYRYSNDQIELEGFWSMNSDNARERISLLFLKPSEYTVCQFEKNDIEGGENLTNPQIKICSANIFECIIINHNEIFSNVLSYLNGEYSGYFMYYGKTIEDRVNLNYNLTDTLIRVNGEGTNNLGHFNIIGYMNFYRNKDEIVSKNLIDSEFIKLADFRLTKIYTAFNPNENNRVIKSYQHRRKKDFDEDF